MQGVTDLVDSFTTLWRRIRFCQRRCPLPVGDFTCMVELPRRLSDEFEYRGLVALVTVRQPTGEPVRFLSGPPQQVEWIVWRHNEELRGGATDRYRVTAWPVINHPYHVQRNFGRIVGGAKPLVAFEGEMLAPGVPLDSAATPVA